MMGAKLLLRMPAVKLQYWLCGGNLQSLDARILHNCVAGRNEDFMWFRWPCLAAGASEPDHRPRLVERLESRHLGGVQGDRRRRGGVVDLLEGCGADDRCGETRAVEEPGERDAARRDAP